MSDPASYRTKEQLEKFRLDDPITRLASAATREKKTNERAVRQMDRRRRRPLSRVLNLPRKVRNLRLRNFTTTPTSTERAK